MDFHKPEKACDIAVWWTVVVVVVVVCKASFVFSFGPKLNKKFGSQKNPSLKLIKSKKNKLSWKCHTRDLKRACQHKNEGWGQTNTK